MDLEFANAQHVADCTAFHPSSLFFQLTSRLISIDTTFSGASIIVFDFSDPSSIRALTQDNKLCHRADLGDKA